MSGKKPHNPIRPSGADYHDQRFLVRDRIVEGRPVKIWGENLLYDDAWRLKERIAAERKSTTVRLESMADAHPDALAVVAAGPTPGRPVAQSSFVVEHGAVVETTPSSAAMAAARAAAEAANARREQTPSPFVPPALEPPVLDLDTELAAIEHDPSGDLELGDLEGDEDLDALIDAANAENAKQDPPT